MNALTSDQQVCERVVKINLHGDILVDLESFSAGGVNEAKKDVVHIQLLTLHNVVRTVETARPAFRKYGAVDVIQKFRGAVELQVFVRAYFVMFITAAALLENNEASAKLTTANGGTFASCSARLSSQSRYSTLDQ